MFVLYDPLYVLIEKFGLTSLPTLKANSTTLLTHLPFYTLYIFPYLIILCAGFAPINGAGWHSLPYITFVLHITDILTI